MDEYLNNKVPLLTTSMGEQEKHVMNQIEIWETKVKIAQNLRNLGPQKAE